jgi:hypothetical protein
MHFTSEWTLERIGDPGLVLTILLFFLVVLVREGIKDAPRRAKLTPEERKREDEEAEREMRVC